MKTDQTGWKPSLILVFPERTWHFFGFTLYIWRICRKLYFFLISATFLKKIELMLRPKSDTLHALLTEDKYKWLWNIVNFVPFLRDYVMKQVYISKFRFQFNLNPYLPSEPVYQNQLDESISNYRGVWCTFSFLLCPQLQRS